MSSATAGLPATSPPSSAIVADATNLVAQPFIVSSSKSCFRVDRAAACEFPGRKRQPHSSRGPQPGRSLLVMPAQGYAHILDLGTGQELVDGLLTSHARLLVSAERHADVVRAR